jgi:hypothetical protein
LFHTLLPLPTVITFVTPTFVAPTFDRARGVSVAVALAGPATTGVAPRARIWLPARFPSSNGRRNRGGAGGGHEDTRAKWRGSGASG